MRKRGFDGGLAIVGLVLVGIGGYAVFGGQIHFSPIAPREDGGFGGPVALIVGLALMGGGLYFLWESLR